MAKTYWSRTDLADYIGVKVNSLSRYRLPQADVYIGTKGRRTAGWLPDTVRRWHANRPGQGKRTDLNIKQ